MPTTIGGNINCLKDIITRLEIGADKVSINTKAINDTNFIQNASREFGSQCLVVSVDVNALLIVETNSSALQPC